MRTKYPTIDFDRLRLYFGEPYTIKCRYGEITLLSPTVGDIIAIGEDKFYSTLNIIVANTTSYRLFLWDLPESLDWNEVTDFELFCMIKQQLDPDASRLLFGDLDFSLFVPKIRNVDEHTKKLVLVNEEQNVEIGEDEYQQFHQYYQLMFNMHPEELLTADAVLKDMWIKSDRREQQRKKKKKKDDKKYSMQPMVSALVNHPGFKYKLKELKEVGIAEFYDSVQRLQIYEQSTALLKGVYGGMISAKDIKPDQYNFMRDMQD